MELVYWLMGEWLFRFSRLGQRSRLPGETDCSTMWRDEGVREGVTMWTNEGVREGVTMCRGEGVKERVRLIWRGTGLSGGA